MSLVQVQYSSPFKFLVLYLKWIENTAHNRIVLGSIPSRTTNPYVPVAEMVDAVDLKSTILLKDVEVQVLLGTPNKLIKILLDILVKI